MGSAVQWKVVRTQNDMVVGCTCVPWEVESIISKDGIITQINFVSDLKKIRQLVWAKCIGFFPTSEKWNMKLQDVISLWYLTLVKGAKLLEGTQQKASLIACRSLQKKYMCLQNPLKKKKGCKLFGEQLKFSQEF